MGILDNAKKHINKAADSAGDIAGKAANVASDAATKAARAGTVAAKAAAEGAQNVAQAAQDLNRDLMIKHFNPIMRAEYEDPNFDLPNMIIIVDEDERKGIEVCEGSIGWLTKHDGTEVLHLYDEFVDECGLTFYPFPTIGGMYLTNRFNDGRFVELSSFLATSQQDRMTELKQIAQKLGAKECRLYTYESEMSHRDHSSKKSTKLGGKFNGIKANETQEVKRSESSEETHRREMTFEQHFEGTKEPMQPELKWYAHDKEINSLIESRLSDEVSSTSEYHISLDCTSASSMSVNLAAKIDNVLADMKSSISAEFEDKIKTEMQRKMDFYVRF